MILDVWGVQDNNTTNKTLKINSSSDFLKEFFSKSINNDLIQVLHNWKLGNMPVELQSVITVMRKNLFFSFGKQ